VIIFLLISIFVGIWEKLWRNETTEISFEIFHSNVIEDTIKTKTD